MLRRAASGANGLKDNNGNKQELLHHWVFQVLHSDQLAVGALRPLVILGVCDHLMGKMDSQNESQIRWPDWSEIRRAAATLNTNTEAGRHTARQMIGGFLTN